MPTALLNNRFRRWYLSALLYFAVVAVLGAFLRYTFVGTVPGITYNFFLHAHSHTALLGWLYAAVFSLLVKEFLPSEKAPLKKYNILFWLSQLAVLGMLFSFPFEGYAAISIIFSTLHIMLSYLFAWHFLRDMRMRPASPEESSSQSRISRWFIRAAFFYLVFSSIGPFSLGPMMVNGMKGSIWYSLAVYFYLHFQYNGWLSMAVFGLFFRLLEKQGIMVPAKRMQWIFILMAGSVLPGYLLSALWTQPPVYINLIAAASALMQLVGMGLLMRIIIKVMPALRQKLKPDVRLLLILSMMALILKVIMQTMTAFPYYAILADRIRELVIGYLHLTLIGFVSLFVIAYGALSVMRVPLTGEGSSMHKPRFWPMRIFLLGFVGSEALIFTQGIFFWAQTGMISHYYLLLFLVTLLLPVGLILYWVERWKGVERG